MSFLIDVLNGVQKLVTATPAAVGAEPALSDPGPGTWYLRAIDNVRSWVASIPWAGVDKTGAVASDVGAEPALGNPGPGTWFLKTISGVRSWVASIPWAGVDKTGAVASDVGALPSLVIGGDVDANSINGGASCTVKFQGVTSWTNFPFANFLLMSGKGGVFTQLSGKDSGISQCWTDLTDGGTYRRNYVTIYGWSPWYTDWDSYNLPAGTTGKALLATASQAAARSAISALPTANPTATGTLTAPDVVVSNLAGTGTRSVATDSTGKLVLAGAGDTVTATASSGALTSLTDTNIVSASLSAGKWLVSVNFHLYAGGSGAGSVTIFNSGISTTSATRLADNFDTNENLQSPLTFGMSRPYMCHRVVMLASPGTVYGVALIVATGPVAFFANAGLIATKLSD